MIARYELTPELKQKFHEIEIRAANRDKDLKPKLANAKEDKAIMTEGVRDYGWTPELYTMRGVDGTTRPNKTAQARKVVKALIEKRGLTDDDLDRLITLDNLKEATGMTEAELIDNDLACLALEQIAFSLKKNA